MNKIAKKIMVIASAEDLCNTLNQTGKTYTVESNALQAAFGMNIKYVPQYNLNKIDKDIIALTDGKLSAKFIVQIVDPDNPASPPQNADGKFQIKRSSTYYIDGREVLSDFDDYNGQIFDGLDKASQMATPNLNWSAYNNIVLDYLMENNAISDVEKQELSTKEFLKDADA